MHSYKNIHPNTKEIITMFNLTLKVRENTSQKKLQNNPKRKYMTQKVIETWAPPSWGRRRDEVRKTHDRSEVTITRKNKIIGDGLQHFGIHCHAN